MSTPAETLPKAAKPKKVREVPQTVAAILPDLPLAPEVIAANAKLGRLRDAAAERRHEIERLERRQSDLGRNLGDAIADGTPTAKILTEVAANDAEIRRLTVEHEAIKVGDRHQSAKLYSDKQTKSADLPAYWHERKRIEKAWNTINEEAREMFGEVVVGLAHRYPAEIAKIEAKNAFLDTERLRLAREVAEGRFK
jgi:hypothetical protein